MICNITIACSLGLIVLLELGSVYIRAVEAAMTMTMN